MENASPSKRLHDLEVEDITAWRLERLRIGQQRYGDNDVKRYNLLDVMEELLDSVNILERMRNRAVHEERSQEFIENLDKGISDIMDSIISAIEEVVSLDKKLPDDFCTDENGENRIWYYG